MNNIYDPDRMNADDLDFDDPEVVDAYLSHPNTTALADDLGRQFQSLPAAEQIAELEVDLEKERARRHQLAEILDGKAPTSDDPRFTLLSAIDDMIEKIERRIAVLRG